MQRLLTSLWMILVGTSWSAQNLDFPSTPPTDPIAATKSFHVLDGFEMQLIAAEPLISDPVAITYDADGRAYVCEMNDYPYTDKIQHKHAQENPTDAAIGRVRLITDTDGDGVFDKATVFAEGLSWPTGGACWKGGIFVTATPDVWYLKDTTGDGIADIRQKIFTGFKKLNVQAVMNNPIWGLDHRIYVAGGSNGGEIQRVSGSESVMPIPKDFKPLPIKRNDFSFDPSTGDVRLESGGARFGNTFDDWGNRFLCNIRNPCQHVVLPYRYLERNPYLVVPSALNDCAEAGDQLPVYRTSPPEPWREFRAKRWVQEGSTLPKSELVGAGVVTSSSGITIYRGDAYPPEYRDFAFVADVAGNLFYRMKLLPDGVTFKAVQVDGTKNFCTSDDLWFRPVNFVNAPDGCLHVCDMYREVIEHPWSIPDDIHAALDLLRGRDKGRIWRLAPKGGAAAPAASSQARGLHHTPKLSTASTTDLVALLDHPNAWHRETAQRLLFERQDQAAVEPLRELVKGGKTAQGTITALWALNSVATSNPRQAVESAISALTAQDSKVRANACQLLADKNISLTDSEVSFEHFKNETENAVQLWLALWHGNLKQDYAGRLLAHLAWENRSHRNDSWLQTAILSYQDEPAIDSVFLGFASLWALKEPEAEFPYLGQLAYRMALSSDLSKDPMLPQFITGSGFRKVNSRLIVLQLLRGLKQQNKEVPSWMLNSALAELLSEWRTELLTQIEDSKADIPLRSKSLSDLSLLADFQSVSHKISAFLEAKHPVELQLAALEALGSYREPAVADMLIDAWPKMTPTLRDKATTILLSRTDRIAKLLDAIEAKKITPAQLSVAAKATLGRQKTPALAERIAKLIGDGSSSNRKDVIAKYASVMTMTGDAARGAKIYEAACMVCHKFADKGNDIGPHLGTIKAWTAAQLVTNILDPNREVSPNFALYLVETNDGRTLSGLIASETAGNLTLKRADGGTDTVLRSEIKSLTSPGISLMPEGLEAAISPQQMADLLSFLRAD